jgi:hypothetical protein
VVSESRRFPRREIVIHTASCLQSDRLLLGSAGIRSSDRFKGDNRLEQTRGLEHRFRNCADRDRLRGEW